MFTALTRMVRRSVTRFNPTARHEPAPLSLLPALILLLLSAFAVPVQAATPFTTNGGFSVGGMGSATYSVPIQVPPGTAGMAPTLSLNYSSTGDNGMLGMGWGLDGLSQISRCPQTMRQDGAVFGVNYKSTDRFCLDGERLYATSDVYNTATKTHATTSAYGASGTEYRTENANFARVVSYGVVANMDGTNSPAYFKVWTKSGQVIEYGNTDDSRIEAAEKTVVRTWGVNKISDTKGNYMTVSYVEDNPKGEAYVSKVDYTGNTVAGLSPYASVQFTYEARPDNKSKEYVGGSVIKKTKRMTNIKTYSNGALVKDYRITYANKGAYSQGDDLNEDTLEFNKNGSLITQITECDGNTTTPTCLQPTVFTWQIGTVLNGKDGVFSTVKNWLPSTSSEVLAVGDVNGDGIKDILYVVYGTATSTWGSGTYYLALGTATGFSAQTTSLGTVTRKCVFDTSGMAGSSCGTFSHWEARPFLADVNRDGKADLVVGTQVRLSTGTAFGATTTWSPGKVVAVGDYDGDFMSDVVYELSPTTTTRKIALAKSNGTQFVAQGLTFATQNKACLVSTTAMGTTTCNQYGEPGERVFLADVDGDGKADFIRDNKVRLSISTPSNASFEDEKLWLSTLSDGSIFNVGDYDGNGMADVMYLKAINSYSSPGNYVLASSDGKTFNDMYKLGSAICYEGSMAGCTDKPIFHPRWFVQDISYDGLGDLLDTYVKLGLVTEPDFLVKVSLGLGQDISIGYSKLSESLNGTAIYVSDYGTTSQTTYPMLDILAISKQPVVSRASSSNGIGGSLMSYYTYGGAKVHLEGLGNLGFRYQTVKQVDDDTENTTFYRQDYPFAGMPLQTQSKITSTGDLISASQLSYANSPLGTGSAVSQFPYVTETIQQGFELGNATAISTTKTNNQYDIYGNVTQVKVDSMDGHIKTTNNVYYNDSSNWILGRLLRSTVSSTNPYTTPAVTVPTAPLPSTNVAPSISLTVPTSGSSVASGTAITVSATAMDSDGTVSKVEFYDGTTLIGTDTTSPYSISWSGAAVGAHSLTATATDNLSAVTSSSTVSLTVTSSGTNNSTTGLLSQGKTTSQSSTLAQPQRGEAYRAVDGNTNGAWQWNSDTNSLSHTASETESQAWWQVDLGEAATISQVKLWNRTDCCGERLANFYVFIATTDMTGRTLAQLTADSTVSKQQVSSLSGAASLVLEMGNASGRYVRVQLAGTGYLSLAEVEVYGSTGSSTPAPANVNPTISLTAPANNGSSASGTAITVSATATDSDGTVSKVEFFDGTTLIGTDTTSPYSISWSGAAVGAHSLTAKVTDNANAETTSSVVSFSVTSGSSGSSNTLLSQGKPTSQSTSLQYGEASRAVDGNTNGAWQWSNTDTTNSLSHTNSETENQAWWQVDLGQSATVNQVKLWNRTDCCGDRLSNFYVFISTTDMTGRTLDQLVADNTVIKQQVSSLNGAASLTLEMGGASGRYVRVQRTGVGYLTMAEVEVYGQ